MLKLGLSLFLLVNQATQYEVIGQLSAKNRARFGNIRIESLDGRFVQEAYLGLDNKFHMHKIPEGVYHAVVRIGRSREVRQTLSVIPAFADKKKRVLFTVDVDKAVVDQKATKVNIKALSIPQKARDEFRKSFESKGDLEKVQQHLEAAIRIAPDFEEALNNLGTIYNRRREFEKARELFERAVKATPDSFIARVNLGGVLLSLGQFDRALEENTRAVTLRPTDALGQTQLGLSFFYRKQFSDALPHLQVAKDTDPLSPALPGLFLAAIQDLLGNGTAAIAEYQDFLKLHPGHPASASVEKRLVTLKSKTDNL